MQKRLKVLSLGFTLAPVGPDAVGGSEQVLSAIDHALVRAGHQSTVIACAGSVVAGELVALPPVPAVIDDAARLRAQQAMRVALGRVQHQADLLHLHGLDFHRYLPAAGPPVLVTLHLPLSWYPPEAFAPARPDVFFNTVSPAQHRVVVASGLVPAERLLPPILNGVPLDRLAATRHACRGHALMLARVCEEKGQHTALMAAHAADMTLLLGGEVCPYPAHQAYFATAVRPLLDRHRRWLGPLDFRRKRRLLASAACLLVPSTAEETGSLATMEAMACGTPVIAYRHGVLPDLVQHGVTGFIVDDVGGMVTAMRNIGGICRDACRVVAQQRFSQARMVAQYLDLYARMVARPAAAA